MGEGKGSIYRRTASNKRAPQSGIGAPQSGIMPANENNLIPIRPIDLKYKNSYNHRDSYSTIKENSKMFV